MRDGLTLAAGLVVAVLAAALAVPPLVDWTAYRSWIDRGLSGALGQEVRTSGPLDLRLLPTPRLRAHRLTVGRDGRDPVSLDALFVRAELAATPLLAGEVRLLDTRIGRAEVKVATGASAGWAVPARWLAEARNRRGWALEGVAIGQLLVTVADPGTGRTDQAYAEAVRLAAGSLAGPWRIAGETRGQPFEAVLGELDADGTAALKLAGGGRDAPRLDVDGRLQLRPGPGDGLLPRVVGTARLVRAAAERAPAERTPAERTPDPSRPRWSAQAAIVAEGAEVRLTGLTLDAGAAPTRLAGEGRVDVASHATTLALTGRRLDWDGIRSLLVAERPAADLPVNLALDLDALELPGGEELTRLSLSVSVAGVEGRISSVRAEAPGGASLQGEGAFRLGVAPSVSGRVAFTARDGSRFVRALAATGLPDPGPLVGPEPLEGSAEVVVAEPVVALPRFRARQGAATIGGSLRRTAAEDGRRARVDAQLAATGIDVAGLSAGRLGQGLMRDTDVALTIAARDVRYAGSGSGRITGRLAAENGTVRVDGLEVRDVAGANATLSGRTAPDGAGRLEGRLVAPRAAPLLDLLGEAWLGGLARFVPPTLRDQPVDLSVAAERSAAAPGVTPAGLRTVVSGRLGGGPLEIATMSAGGTLTELSLAARSDSWLPAGGPDAVPVGGTLDLTATRDGTGRLLVTGGGQLGNASARVIAPLRLSPDDAAVVGGSLRVDSPDAAPLLARFGFSGPGIVPVSLTIGTADGRTVTIEGTAAGTTLAASVARSGEGGAVTGTASVGRLSVPALLSGFAFGPKASGEGPWSSARFGPAPTVPLAATLAVRAETVDLGGSLSGRDGTATLAMGPDGLRVSDARVAVDGGVLGGGFIAGRQGGLATLSGNVEARGWPISRFAGAPFGPGRLSGTLRFGASGESPATLVAALGGTGALAIEALAVAGADPAAPARVAAQALESDDPLAGRLWPGLLAAELAMAPLLASGPVSVDGVLSGGVLRLSPLAVEAATGGWRGSAAIDLRTLSLDIRGVLRSAEAPPAWTGAPPSIGLGWTGPAARPAPRIDPNPLVNGLAANVLQRELNRIDEFDRRRGGPPQP